MDKLKVGVYGATGAVGLEAIEALQDHPWFEISHLYASDRGAGQIISGMVVERTDFERVPEDIDIAFFALAERAKEYELKYAPKFAKRVPVITTSSAFRMHGNIPLIITEVNADHIQLAEDYKREFDSKNFPLPQPNCTAVPPSILTKPLLDTVGVEEVHVDSYQSVSGAGVKALGKWADEREREREARLPEPFPSSFNFNPPVVYEGNIRPIGERDSKEEERKVREETLKMLGKYRDGTIVTANFKIIPCLDRAPVKVGHYEHIKIKTEESYTSEEIALIYQEFNAKCRELYGKLPSSPEETIVLLDRQPQPRFDGNIGNGMSIVIGPIEIEEGWIKLRALSNNLRKGSAKGSVQLLEYLFKSGFL